MRGARRAWWGMCPACARGKGKPIVTSRGGDCPDEAEKAGDGDVTAAAAEAYKKKKVNLEEHKALLADARSWRSTGVYM